jgi:hypothetical protein
MSRAANDVSMTTALRRIWTDGRSVERVAYVVGAVLFASGLVHLGVLVVTGGTWEGPLSLRKPTTFGLSFGLTLATVAWASSFATVRPALRNVLLGAFTVASVVETVLVTMQAWRGVPSHFNFETGFDTAVSTTLAGGGAVIIVTALSFTAAAVLGTAALRPSMRVALRFGFLMLLVALGTGAAMIATGVAAVRSGDPQLAYATAGSLKPLHGVAMHAILVVPAAAWLLGLVDRPERQRVRLVWLAVAAYSVMTAAAAIFSL